MNTLHAVPATIRSGTVPADRRSVLPLSDRLAMRAGLLLMLWADARAARRPTYDDEQCRGDRERAALRRRDLLLPPC